MRFPEQFRYPYQDTPYSSNPGDPFPVPEAVMNAATTLHEWMTMQGDHHWRLGNCASRNWGSLHDDLHQAIKRFLKALEQREHDVKEYARAKQALYSALKKTPRHPTT